MPFAPVPYRHKTEAWKFEQWRRRQAQLEYRRFVGRFTSADHYKDDPHRRCSRFEHGEEVLRQYGGGKGLADIKDGLRERWSLPRNADIHP